MGGYGAVPAPVASAIDRDSALREVARRQAIEVLQHQLEMERRERVRVEAKELLFTAVLLGATFGTSYGLVRWAHPQRLARKAKNVVLRPKRGSR